MKTIGLIGGMSWESSTEYYRCLNENIKARLGGFHSAKCILFSVDFGEIEPLMRKGRWEQIEFIISDAARILEKGGSEIILICTNTIHKIAERVEKALSVPLLHIADPTGRRIKELNINTIGLLGTRFTMEEDFYRRRLAVKFGLRVIVPDQKERELVDKVIFEELCLGKIRTESKNRYLDIMQKMIGKGAEGIILGCTEIGMLVNQKDKRYPLFDTTSLHAEAAVEFALSG